MSQGGRGTVVLLVDDEPRVADALRRVLLEEVDFEFHHSPSATRALQLARLIKPTVILQDLVMPEIDGFTLVRLFRADAQLANVPIIVLSSKEDPEHKSRAFELGVSDYLVKLPSKLELIARVRAHSRSYVAQLERDEAYKKLEELHQQLAAANAELQRLTVVDPLTLLPNRRRLDDALDSEWRRCRREGLPLSVIMIDVDHFKRYNDAYGHQQGDECLRQVAEVLRVSARRPADLLARYGGEEFVALLPNTPPAAAHLVAERVRANLLKQAIPHKASETAPCVTLSLGIAGWVPGAQDTAEDLMAAADAALYEAKRSGRNRVHTSECDTTPSPVSSQPGRASLRSKP